VKTLFAFALLAATAQAADIPRPAPNLTVPLISGGQVSLSQYRGKVLVVEFLLTHCPGCQHSGRVLEGLRRELGPRGFDVLGIAINADAKEKVLEFRGASGATYPIAFLSDETKVREILQIPIMVRLLVPQLLIIDRNGVIREQHGGDDNYLGPNEEKNLRESITRLAAEGRPTRKAAPARKAPAKK
jgi:peroxiredoxin